MSTKTFPTDITLHRQGIYLISPSGVVRDQAALRLARRRLTTLGFPTTLDRCALAVHEHLAGTDAQRLGGIARALQQECPIVMATRGGYGMSRLLPHIDWRAVADSGKTFVGFSDFTAFNLALLARTGAQSFSGPVALADFGGQQVNPTMCNTFIGMMRGQCDRLRFDASTADAVDVRGVLWGGNLAMVASLLGTPYMPKVRGGILFLEDVNEHPYRIERMLVQLWQAGILEKQKAVLLGNFTLSGPMPKTYVDDLNAVLCWLRATVNVPVVSRLPYGHVETKVTLPIGRRVHLATEGGVAHLLFQQGVRTGKVPVSFDDRVPG